MTRMANFDVEYQYDRWLEEQYERAYEQFLEDEAALAKAQAEFQSYLDDQEDEYPR